MQFLNDSGLRACWVVGRVPPARLSATFIVKGTFRLRHRQTVELLPFDEQEDPTGDVFRDDDPARALLYPSDFALVKPRADATLVGSFHAPESKPIRTSTLSFAINSWVKTLAIVGDRNREKGVLGYSTPDPEPFVQMEISWERTFGGPGEADNPLGRGVKEEVRPDGSRILPMPNIGTVGKMIYDSGRPAPASFAPVPLTWAERMRKAGTFDAKWLEERWPWFPEDVDWSIFNAAPRDQQFEFFRGDEKLSLENLHRTHAILETWLPGLRPRVFARRDTGAGPEFFEIRLRLDTLHIDADQEKLYLVWRGLSEIRSKEMKEYRDFYVVCEPLSAAPAPIEHHASVFDRQTAKPAEPAPAKWPLIEEGPVPQPSDDWVAGAEKAAAQIEADAAAFQAETDARIKDLAEMLRPHGLKLPQLEPAPTFAPAPSPADLLAIALERHALLQTAAPDLAAKFPAPQLADFEPPKIEAPPDEPPGIPDMPVTRQWTRESCEVHARARGSFAGETLSELDLSGLDLHGLDFRGAILKSSTLANANLSEASLRGASLSGSDLHEADLRNADLDQTDFTKVDLTGADLRRAAMTTAEFRGARMKKARLDGAQADEAIFCGADLTGAVLQGGSFDLADFDEALLDGADLTNAVLTHASFEGAHATGVRASGARLSGARAAHADFSGSVFQKADAEGSIWEEANLEGADFTGAFLRSANFAGASLRKARLRRADLKHARLPGAVLEQADVSLVNLFRATLEGAVLSAADFRGSNLFEAEFYEAQWTGATFTGANLKGSKLDGQS